MNELQRLIFQQACQPIYVEPLLPDDREALMAFSEDIATADLKPGEFELVMVDLIRLREACRLRYQEHREAQRRRTQASNNAKAKAAKYADQVAWMWPHFDAAWAELEKKGRKRIGFKAIYGTAIQILGKDREHPDYERRYEIGVSPAKTYWESRRKVVNS